MKKTIEKLRLRLGLWLLITPTMTATAAMISKQTEDAKCIHCGKNPFITHLEGGHLKKIK